MRQALAHFKTITKHRRLVRRGCFRVGLYYQGLTHDLSKYTPVEFFAGCRYFSGTESPNNAQRRDLGLSPAWLHHKGRNRHHFEYWIDYSLSPDRHLTGMKMPVKYVVEMFMDRVAASRVYQKDAYTDRSALEYYQRSPVKELIHPESAALLESMLYKLAAEGEKAVYDYIRTYVL